MEKKSIEEQIYTWSLRFLLVTSVSAIAAGLDNHIPEAVTIGSLGVVCALVMNYGIGYLKYKSGGITDYYDKTIRMHLFNVKLATLVVGVFTLYELFDFLY